jgi:hypothetical protein
MFPFDFRGDFQASQVNAYRKYTHDIINMHINSRKVTTFAPTDGFTVAPLDG